MDQVQQIANQLQVQLCFHLNHQPYPDELSTYVDRLLRKNNCNYPEALFYFQESQHNVQGEDFP